MNVTKDSPWITRFRAYLAERFPPVGHGVLIVSYYSSNQFLSQNLTNPGRPVSYSASSLLGAITLLCFFFHLRVFDEHKDYTEDVVHHPERILSRGIVTLNDLKRAGWVVILIELTCAAVMGPAAFVGWGIAMLFSLLMLREFFAHDWLKRHFLVYAGSHMLIMPLLALMVYSFATGRFPWQAPPLFVLYAFVGFWVTLNWEVARKIRAPGDELPGVVTYSSLWGPFGAAYAVVIIRVIDTLMVSLVGMQLGLSPLFYGVLGCLFLVCLGSLIQFRRHPSARTAKRMESVAGIYIIAFDLTLAIEIIRKVGMSL